MKKVLVADDTKNIRVLLSTCLELEGYEVLIAKDGQHALDMFKTEIFDLAFLDIKMPEISGTEVLRSIRELGIDIPIIIMTAFATVKNAVECTKMGAVAYLQKPFTADKVKAVLKDLDGGKCSSRQVLSVEKSVRLIEDAINQGMYSEALDLLKKAIAVEPTNPTLYFLFAKTYEGTGETEYAQKFYKTFELFNNNPTG
ncbi:MAG: response regulator [Clostridia bacterium]|nr:response regulator [Clostridia bacterium]